MARSTWTWNLNWKFRILSRIMGTNMDFSMGFLVLFVVILLGSNLTCLSAASETEAETQENAQDLNSTFNSNWIVESKSKPRLFVWLHFESNRTQKIGLSDADEPFSFSSSENASRLEIQCLASYPVEWRASSQFAQQLSDHGIAAYRIPLNGSKLLNPEQTNRFASFFDHDGQGLEFFYSVEIEVDLEKDFVGEIGTCQQIIKEDKTNKNTTAITTEENQSLDRDDENNAPAAQKLSIRTSGGNCSDRSLAITTVNNSHTLNFQGSAPAKIQRTEGQNEPFYIGDTNRTLSCSATGKPPPIFKWTRLFENDTEIILNFTDLSRFDLEESPAETVSSFVFPTIDKDIEGIYICEASNLFGLDNQTFNVTTKDPKITFENDGAEQIREFKIGDPTGTLICTAIADPKPSFKWLDKNGMDLKDDSSFMIIDFRDGVILQFPKFHQNLEGAYFCEATNKFQNSNQTFQVNIKVLHFQKIRTPTPVIENVFYVGENGTNLSCSAPQEPNSTFEWTKNSRNGVESVIFPTILLGNKSILQFPTMVKVVEGTYVCEVGNERKSTVHTFEVTVRDPKPPEIKTEEGGDERERVFYTGEDKRNLICAATGDPVPNFKWTKNGTELGENVGFSVQPSANGAILSFPTITQDHQGDYFCVASNRFATVHRKFPVNVKSQSQKDSCLSNKEIVGIVIGILIFILAFLFILFKYWQIWRKLRNLTADEIDEFLKGNPDRLGKSEDAEGHENIHFLPFNKQFEVPQAEFSIDEKINLGSGEFGVICGGKLRGVDVAIKTTKSTVNVDFFLAFLKEIKMMTFIGKHPNVVELLGTSTLRIRERVVFVILELGIHGDLNSFLTEHQEQFMSIISPSQVLNDQSEQASSAESETKAEMGSGYLSVPLEAMAMQLIKWCGQIAAGMSHLGSKKIIHTDLAARNILLFDGYTAKISDFGFSRRLYSNVYSKKGATQLPWRIMAPESLKHLQFSLKSDVWAFGVLVWEIFSLGAVPFSGYEYSLEFIQKLEQGLRLPKPEWAADEIYKNMKECWAAEAENRPGFDQLEQFYADILDSISGTGTATGCKVESE